MKSQITDGQIRKLTKRMLKVDDTLDAILRTQKEILSQLTLIYDDHNLIEKVEANVTSLHSRLDNNLEHYERFIKDAKADIIEEILKTQENVQKTTDKTIKHVTSKTSGITEALEKENIIGKKDTIIAKLRKKLKK